CVGSACCANAACTSIYDWTRVFAGPANAEYPTNIASTSDGGMIVVGQFRSSVDFDPGPGVDTRVATGTTADCFVTKLDANGAEVWTRTFGGAGEDAPYGVKVLSDNSIVVVGTFAQTVDFDPGAGVDSRSATGTDGFVLKLDAGGLYQW